MRIYKATSYRVYPTAEQSERLHAWQASVRFLWNLALEQRLISLARPLGERRYPTAFRQQLEVKTLRADLPWLDDVPRNVCDYTITELDKAWERCFKRISRAPKFKAKNGQAGAMTEPHPKAWRILQGRIRFPKLGWMRAIVHRPLQGKRKTCSLYEESGQWFASIVCEIDIPDPEQRTGPVVALDRGVVNVVTDSDGDLSENPKHLDAAKHRLTRAQRNLGRKQKGSNNRLKARQRVAIIHRKIRRQREHMLHNLSAKYAKSHGVVVVEKLNIQNMTKSAAGTVESPGRNVAQKSGLNRAILASGWGRLVQMLRYKLAWNGGSVVEVPAAYSSQTCSTCGHVASESRKSQASFECVSCGACEHADVNAAKVLLQRFQTGPSRSCQPVEGSPVGALRSRKRLRAPRRSAESTALKLS